MSGKGLGTLIVAILALVGGAFAATVLIRKKLAKKDEDTDFDLFESPVDDEEFEHFFGDDEDELTNEAADEDSDGEAAVPEEAEEEADAEEEEQL